MPSHSRIASETGTTVEYTILLLLKIMFIVEIELIKSQYNVGEARSNYFIPLNFYNCLFLTLEFLYNFSTISKIRKLMLI